MKAKGGNEPMELVTYGVFRQNFFAVVKQYGKYVLHRMISVPECGFCNEQAVIEHILEFEEDACSRQYVFEGQDQCFKRLLFDAGSTMEDRNRTAAEGMAFTDEDLLLLSRGMLSMMRGTEQALRLADYDDGVHFAVLKAQERYKELNTRVCDLVSRSCN